MSHENQKNNRISEYYDETIEELCDLDRVFECPNCNDYSFNYRDYLLHVKKCFKPETDRTDPFQN